MQLDIVALIQDDIADGLVRCQVFIKRDPSEGIKPVLLGSIQVSLHSLTTVPFVGCSGVIVTERTERRTYIPR
jgi:hypothetical protein